MEGNEEIQKKCNIGEKVRDRTARCEKRKLIKGGRGGTQRERININREKVVWEEWN